jgi:hypothetical protein
VFVGGGADAELEANTSITQSFVHATDDEKVGGEGRSEKKERRRAKERNFEANTASEVPR